MILKAEPKTIMSFMESRFDVLHQLYRIQLAENLIPAAVFTEITRHEGDTVTRRLFDFRIIREAGSDYRITEEIMAYLGFLTQEFKPLLPEQLRRYHTSIEDIYDRLMGGKTLSSEQRILRLGHLYDEVRSFLDKISANTVSLLQRTQELKVNRDQRQYAERVREARILIEEYIDPLNSIVDLNDANSIAALLGMVGRGINRDRFASYPPSGLDAYEQLDQLLRQVNGVLQREANVIRRELTPLLERIKRESEVMNGWLTFLERPFLHPVPEIGHRHRVSLFGDQTGADLKMYVEQFMGERPRSSITLKADPAVFKPIFQPHVYRQRLESSLPVTDFFGWCEQQLTDVAVEHREHYLLKLTSLLFGEQSSYVLHYGAHRRPLQLGGSRYTVPTLSVSK